MADLGADGAAGASGLEGVSEARGAAEEGAAAGGGEEEEAAAAVCEGRRMSDLQDALECCEVKESRLPRGAAVSAASMAPPSSLAAWSFLKNACALCSARASRTSSSVSSSSSPSSYAIT